MSEVIFVSCIYIFLALASGLAWGEYHIKSETAAWMKWQEEKKNLLQRRNKPVKYGN